MTCHVRYCVAQAYQPVARGSLAARDSVVLPAEACVARKCAVTLFLAKMRCNAEESWNQLPAGLLASFPCKLDTFRKRVKNVVTSKGLHVGFECK